jgi:superfamily II DNA or RNA helicase
MTAIATEFRKPVPRDYQALGKSNFLSGDGNLLIQLATGMGKTNLSAMIAAEYPGQRVLFLAHTRTLVFQTCQTYMRFGMWPNLEMADEYTGGPYLPDARDKKKIFRDKFPPNEWFEFDRVLVSTIQSFCGRVDKYREGGFDLLVHDECHRFGGVFLRTLERLKQFNPHMRVCGLSATPYNGKKLAAVYSGFALRVPVTKAIDDGYLVGVECERATLEGVDESMWKVGPSKSGGRDITDESLARSMGNRVCIESIAHEVIERSGDKKGILFLPGVAVTESVCEALNELRPGCAVFVHGGVKPKRENRRRIRMIEDGSAQFICGCDQLIEGFDVQDIAVVVMARFTAQRGRYEQMLGRGLRVLADCIEGIHTPEGRRKAIANSLKPTCKVIDFANNSRIRLVSVEDILLDAGDDVKRAKKLSEFVQKTRDANDKRALREQLRDQESLFALEEALREKGGPPPKADFMYEQVNLFGVGGTIQKDAKRVKDDSRRPTTQQIADAYDMMIDPERAEKMSHGQLANEIDRRREVRVGRKGFGFLVGGCKLDKSVISEMCLNWHDVQYLRKMVRARPGNDLPANWKQLVTDNRRKRTSGGD